MIYIDTHCHLDLFQNIKTRVIHEDSLPIKTITVTNLPSVFEANQNLFIQSKNIRVGLGFHPELSGKYKLQTEMFGTLIKHTKYIGEIGLDGSKELIDSFTNQLDVFESILKIIRKEDNKIITVHSRRAENEVITLLEKYLLGTNNKIILHWYTGGKEEMNKAINLGYYFSINHKMVTSMKGRDLIHNMPLEKILTETDAPFTLNEKVRTRIESLDITLKAIAVLKNISVSKMKDIVYENFFTLLSTSNHA